jgi:hypothetical protein
MTNTNKLDEFTTELLTTIIASQKAKREERQALMREGSSWVAQARAMQIKLQKEGSN